MKNKYNALVET